MLFNWDTFIYYASGAWLCWLLAVVRTFRGREQRRFGQTVLWHSFGLLIFLLFIVGFWYTLERPPMRTMGETRLWYSFFLSLVGLLVYIKWHYRWMLLYSTVLSGVFLLINLLKPEIHSKALMPALQSPWFVPHVTVYMFSYALLGCSFLLALFSSYQLRKGRTEELARYFCVADQMVYLGYGFLTLGMLFGAFWAKEAWGHYWSWDPKETWAAITWLFYVFYIHWRITSPRGYKVGIWLLVIAFLCLQMCWYGVNYLPQAKGSIHSYTSN